MSIVDTMILLAVSTNPDLPVVEVTLGLLGGLALFLFGMDQMTHALKTVTGRGLRAMLGRLTTNRFTGVISGTVITAITQSSSVTTVLLVGFVSAGLMTLKQSVGVIMGANIGSTFTAQIIAFNVTKFALAIVTIGFLVQFLGRTQRVRRYGAIVLGLGMIFFGMKLMGDAMQPLRSYQPFIDVMAKMNDPAVLGVLVGAAFTALIQSSAATTGLVIVMASQGHITLEGGIAITLGANVGTCVTALLATLGKPREALQTAVIHILFNVVGVLIWLAFIVQLAGMVRHLSADPARQIANAHTLFNVVNVALFLPFVGAMTWAARRLVPDRPVAEEPGRPKFLDAELLQTPALALERVRLECARMTRKVLRMLDEAAPAVARGTEDQLQRVADMDAEIDALHGHIVEYLGAVTRAPLAEAEQERASNDLLLVNHIESMGDTIETSMVAVGRERIDHDVTISEQTRQKLLPLYATVRDAICLLAEALEEDSPDKAHAVIAFKGDVRREVHAVQEHLNRRLIADAPNRLASYRVEQSFVEHLRRLYYFARHAAWRAVGREAEPEDRKEA